jgi:hypothetical protein
MLQRALVKVTELDGWRKRILELYQKSVSIIKDQRKFKTVHSINKCPSRSILSFKTKAMTAHEPCVPQDDTGHLYKG